MSKYKFHTDGRKTVVCITHFAGKPIKGVAKCSDSDVFDLEKGMELSKARCEYNYYAKKTERANQKMRDARNAYDDAGYQFIKMSDYYEDSKEARNKAFENLMITENKFAK